MKLRTLFVLALLMFIMVSCVSCKKKKEENTEIRKITLMLDWTPNTNHAGLYVARDLGYFKAEGLDVNIVQPGENTVEKMIASGKADFGVSYQESVSIARANSIPIKSVAAIIQHNTSGFASLKKDNILSPKDFTGKRYGSSGWPSELAILKQVMTKAEANPDSVHIVSGVGDFFSTIGKDADFEWIYYGWDGVQAKLKGIDINFIPIREIDPMFDFYTPVLITNDMMINSDPDLIRAFLRAVSKGYEYCVATPEKAAQILSKAVPELDRALVKASLEYLKQEFISDSPKWGMQKPEIWKQFSDWMFLKRITNIGLKASELYTDEYLP
jgi:ABC-type nitrate/sulfonate/bicarbonate transport system substrate-binding protein